MIPDDQKFNNIQGKLELSKNDLLIELGTVESYQVSPVDALRNGKAVYANLVKKTSKLICSDETIRKLILEDASEKRVMLISAVADLIAGYIYNISPITVAVLMTREGLENICASEWKGENEQE